MAGNLENAIRELGLSSDGAEADLEISYIPSAWLLSGQAQTRSRLLGRTQDQLAHVMLWECGAANFKWHYRKDEFLIILSGDAFMAGKNGGERHQEDPGVTKDREVLDVLALDCEALAKLQVAAPVDLHRAGYPRLHL